MKNCQRCGKLLFRYADPAMRFCSAACTAQAQAEQLQILEHEADVNAAYLDHPDSFKMISDWELARYETNLTDETPF